MSSDTRDTDVIVHPTAAPAPEHSGKMVAAAFVGFAAAIALYFTLGMPGMNHQTGSSMPGMEMTTSSGPHRLVGPAEFEALLQDSSATVINVHVPYDGEITHTDLFLPFNEIDPERLPVNRAAELLVYCRSGNMSAIPSSSTTFV